MRSIAALLLFAAPAFADEITLATGGRLRGRIVGDTGARVTVDVGSGTVTIERGQILSIKITPMAQDEFEGRLAAAPETAEGFAQLGTWAQRRGLGTRAREMFEKALAKNPDQPTARRELGFVRRDGQWVTREKAARDLGVAAAERAIAAGEVTVVEPRRPAAPVSPVRLREQRVPLGLQPPPVRPPRYVGGRALVLIVSPVLVARSP